MQLLEFQNSRIQLMGNSASNGYPTSYSKFVTWTWHEVVDGTCCVPNHEFYRFALKKTRPVPCPYTTAVVLVQGGVEQKYEPKFLASSINVYSSQDSSSHRTWSLINSLILEALGSSPDNSTSFWAGHNIPFNTSYSWTSFTSKGPRTRTRSRPTINIQ